MTKPLLPEDPLSKLAELERRLATLERPSGGSLPGGGPAPPGAIIAFAGTVAPAGWLLCDGSTVSRTTYAALFAAIGTTYGVGNGTTTFGLPNLKGRVVIARDAAQTEFDVLGETGGAKTIAEASLPGHTHTISHTHGMSTANTDHAHNVYARNQMTGDHDRGHVHWFNTSTNSEVYTTAIGAPQGGSAHSHQGGGGVGSERPWNSAGEAWAAGHYHNGNTDGANTGHLHNFNHDHPSTNWQRESPWAGNWTHSHSTDSQSASSTGPGTGSGTAHLPPYLVANYVIRT